MGMLFLLKISGFFPGRASDNKIHGFLLYLLTLLFVMVSVMADCVGTSGFARAADPVTEDAARLKQLEKRLQETQQQAESSQHQEKELLERLHVISLERHSLELAIQCLQHQLRALGASMAGEERQLQQVSAAMARQRNEFNHRLKVRYMTPPGVLLEKLLGQQKLKDKINQVTYLKYILMYDQQQLTSFARLMIEHQRIKQSLDQQRQQVTEMKEKKRLKLAGLEENIAKKNKLLYKIRGKKEYYAALIKELAEAAEKLKKIINTRRESTVRHGSLVNYKGRLPMPASGVVVRFFGLERDRRFKTVTENKGIDIEAPLGTEVKAIFPGQVIFASWLKGYGNLIIIDHGEGYYSIYGHLLEFKTKVNKNIRQREVIGSVGDTDSLIGPALYFEIRRHGRPQDPLEWVSPMAQG
jgi:septal ring factor EnvC (AmiA/AmiB activator)